MNKVHDVQKISFVDAMMVIYVDGKKYEIEISEYSERLAEATQYQREKFEVCLPLDMEFIGRILMRICPLMV